MFRWLALPALALAALAPGTTGSPAKAPRAPIVYSTTRDEHLGNADVYSVSVDGDRPFDVTATPVAREFFATVSPQGDLIAFEMPLRNGALHALFVMRVDGTDRRKLAETRFAEPPAWSPDGTRIAFFGVIGAESGLFVTKVDSSGTRFLGPERETSSENRPSWSPDGTQIVWESTGATPQAEPAIAITSADGGPISRIAHGSEPAWSPTGSSIAFLSGTDALKVIRPDGTGERTLVSPGAARPTWSRDGSRIAFTAARANASQLYVVDAGGGNLHPVGLEGSFSPAWSPDSRSIAYVQLRPDPWSLYEDRRDEYVAVVGADGGEPRILTTQPYASISTPSWAPDGRRLFYSSKIDRHDFELATISPASGVIHEFSNDLAEDIEPAWSPDRRRIAFIRGLPDEAGDRGSLESPWVVGAVWVMDANGENARRVTGPGFLQNDHLPAWSPDGKRIVFEHNDNLAVVNVRTGAARDVTHGRTSYQPSWSPDGRSIAFARGVTFHHDLTEAIFVMAPSGRHVRRLGPLGSADPAWSPDGRRIAFSGRHGLSLMDSNGRNVHALYAGWAASPRWSPDGRWIAFATKFRDDERTQLVIIRQDGMHRRLLTKRHGLEDNAWLDW